MQFVPSRRVLIAALAVVLALGSAFLMGWFPQEPLRRLVESRIRKAVGPSSGLAALHVRPGRLRATLSGLVLEAPGYRLELDHLVVSLRPGDLLSSGLALDTVEASGARLLVRPAAGDETAAEPPSGPVVVRRLAITGASIRYEAGDGAGTLDLEGVAVQGGLGAGALQLVATGGSWRDSSRRIALGPAEGRVRVSPDLDITLESLEAGLPRSRFRVQGPIGRPGAFALDLRVAARLHLAEIASLAEADGQAAGELAIEGRVQGALEALRAEAELRGDTLRMAGVELTTVRGRLGHGGDDADLAASLTARLLGGDVDLTGTMDGERSRARLFVRHVDLAALAPLLGWTAHPPTGRGSLSARVDGDRRSMRVDGRWTARGARPDARLQSTGAVAGELRLAERRMDLTWSAGLAAEAAQPGAAWESASVDLRGRARGWAAPTVTADLSGAAVLRGATRIPVTVDGRLGAEGPAVSAALEVGGLGGPLAVEVAARGSRLDLLRLRGSAIDLAVLGGRFRGRVGVDFQAKGPIERLEGAGSMRVDDLAWDGVDLGSATLVLSAAEGTVFGEANAPRLGITVNGRVPLDPGRPSGRLFEGRAWARGTPLDIVRRVLGAERPIEGSLHASADLAVPLERPGDARVEGRVGKLEAAAGGHEMRATQPFDVRLADGVVTVGGLRLESTGLTLELDGTASLSPDGPLEGRLIVDAPDLGALPWPSPFAATGEVHVEAVLRGTVSRPLVEGAVLLRAVEMGGAGVPDLRVAEGRIRLEGDAAAIEGLRGEVAGGALTVDAHVPVAAVLPAARAEPSVVAPGEAARIRVAWDGISAAALAEAAGSGSPARVTGVLRGEAEVTGGLAALQELRAGLSVPRTELTVEDLALQVAPWTASLEDGRLSTAGISLSSEAGTVQAAGSLDLARRQVDAQAEGRLALRALAPFLEEMALRGVAEGNLRVQGPVADPAVEGRVLVRDGVLRMRVLPQALTGIEATVLLSGRTLRIGEGTALIGGGRLTLSGEAGLRGGSLDGARFTLAGRDITLAYPPGMRARLDADLALTGGGDAFLLSGAVRAQRGLYDLDVALREAWRAPTDEAEESSVLRSIALDLVVETDTPVVVRSDLARLQATGRLQVRGDLMSPAPVGALEILPGGSLVLQGEQHEFRIESGRLSYGGTWDAALDIVARAPVRDTGQQSDYTVELHLEGTMERPTMSLTSVPPLSKAQILALLATGRQDLRVDVEGALGSQAASLVAERLAVRTQALGLDEVTLRPELVASETGVDTGARFTFGKRLRDWAEVVYSLSLLDPEKRYVELQVSPGARVTSTLKRRDDGTFSYGLGQEFRGGGTPEPRAASERPPPVEAVRVEGAPDGRLQEHLRTRAGRRASPFDLQDDADRLREELVRRGYLEAEVSAALEEGTAVFEVTSGARYRWRVEGYPEPPELADAVRSSLYEEEALAAGRRFVLAALHAQGHLRAEVDAGAADEDGFRTLVFEARPGPRERLAGVRFEGRTAVPEKDLLEAAGGTARLVSEPEAAAREMEAAYRRRHYLAAEVEPARIDRRPDGTWVVVRVHEGRRAEIAAVRFEGGGRPERELAEAARLEPSAPYQPLAVEGALERLRLHYFRLGHPSVRITPVTAAREGDLEVTFRIEPGERLTVGRVAVVGVRRTPESRVLRLLDLRPGEPVDPARLASLESRLLDTGLFRRAAIRFTEEDPAEVTVEVAEADRWFGRYLAEYQDAQGATVSTDGTLQNLFGGLSTRAVVRGGADVREVRAHLSVPWGPAGRNVVLSAFHLDEDLDAGLEDGTENERVERAIQIEATLPLGGGRHLVGHGRLKRATFTSQVPPFVGNTSVNTVAGLALSYIEERRDDPTDARRGHFLSLGVEYSPSFLWSDLTFVKGTAQFFASRPLSEVLTWAQSWRVGLSGGFEGQPIISSERFRAGGANTLRGFATDSVGPRDALEFPAGGEALLVANQELRYHHPSGLGAAVFYDGGGVFPTVRDFGNDIRHAAGVGLRWASPLGLLRLDAAVPLGRRPGEDAWQWFFSFGQAF